jgi:NTP pyrophosphatase (non-canonical NTP hydrolase)
MNKSVTLDQLIETLMQLAEEKGFGTKPADIDVPEKIALIHSEVTEAFTAYRHKNMQGKDGFEEELGDIILRVLHLCGALGIDIEAAMLKKLEHNKSRTWEWDKLNESRSRSEA